MTPATRPIRRREAAKESSLGRKPQVVVAPSSPEGAKEINAAHANDCAEPESVAIVLSPLRGLALHYPFPGACAPGYFLSPLRG